MGRLSIIAALSRNGVIGRGNELPWHLPEDLRRFKRLTLGHPVVMGRRTFDSIVTRIGQALPGRDNIVVTRSKDYRASGCRPVASIGEAREAAGSTGEIFVIGGAEIYALALPDAERLYLTEIDADIEGDVLFPPWDRAHWREWSRERGTGGSDRPGGGPAFDFVVYDRRTDRR